MDSINKIKFYVYSKPLRLYGLCYKNTVENTNKLASNYKLLNKMKNIDFSLNKQKIYLHHEHIHESGYICHFITCSLKNYEMNLLRCRVRDE